MKKFAGIALVSLIAIILYWYKDFIKNHLLNIFEFILYSLGSLAVLIIIIYIKDRIAYHKLKKEMVRKVSVE